MRQGMKALYTMLCFALFAASSSAADGVFDRRDEVERYVEILSNGTRGAVIDAGREIFDSGIADPALGRALSERLLMDFKRVGDVDRNAEQYIGWMIKALASTGLPEAETTLARVERESRSPTIKKYCTEQRPKISWYRERNALMASRKNYREGDDPKAARLINLLDSEDFTFKQYVADRMDWARILDPRLMDTVEREILRHIDTTVSGSPREQAKAMGMFIKLLGYSGNTKYRDTLLKVKKSKATDLMKKYADESLKRLQT